MQFWMVGILARCFRGKSKSFVPFGPYSMDDCLLTRAKLDKHVSQLVHHWHMDYPMQLGHATIVLLTSISHKSLVNFF